MEYDLLIYVYVLYSTKRLCRFCNNSKEIIGVRHMKRIGKMIPARDPKQRGEFDDVDDNEI